MTTPMAHWKQFLIAGLIIAAGSMFWLEREAVLSNLGLDPAINEVRRDRGAGVPVIVERVTLDRDDLTLEAVGTGRAQRSVMLRPEVAGKVVEIPMLAGQPYAAGDVLLRLDDEDERLAVQLAETRLQEALRVQQRFDRLQTSGSAPASRFDEARTAAQIASLELERAREALTKRILRAPFDGVAGIGDIDTGARIDTDTEIASFDDRSTILVEFELPEALLSRLQTTSTVSATTPAVPGEQFQGSVVAIDTRIAAASRTVKVRVAFTNQRDLLRPGASFIVRLDLPGGSYPVVPELAVLFSRGSLLVWRVVDGKAEQVQVRMVRRRDGAVLVDGPLNPGDAVVVEGTQRLAPGKAVRVMDGLGGETS
ncbi:MAG: efflux RND transporter periplasmic adaptor subunit [Paracoccaceae bacterium]